MSEIEDYSAVIPNKFIGTMDTLTSFSVAYDNAAALLLEFSILESNTILSNCKWLIPTLLIQDLLLGTYLLDFKVLLIACGWTNKVTKKKMRKFLKQCQLLTTAQRTLTSLFEPLNFLTPVLWADSNKLSLLYLLLFYLQIIYGSVNKSYTVQ